MFDPKCYELAEYFLEDYEDITEEQKNELAQHIQDTIEDWLVMIDGNIAEGEDDAE
jgi:uncharacterized membrane-anchored protein YjiN (DUF445 family)